MDMLTDCVSSDNSAQYTRRRLQEGGRKGKEGYGDVQTSLVLKNGKGPTYWGYASWIPEH